MAVLAAIIEVHAATETDQPYRIRLTENLKASAAFVQGPSTRPAENGSALCTAIAELGRTGSRRTPLLFLATQTNAAIAADFVLVADEGLLANLAGDATAFAAAQADDAWVQKLEWLLDRSALQLMAKSAAKTESAQEFASLLSVYAGEAGRHADSIEEILKTVNSRRDLELRLTAENLIFLEDNSPSARVRAFDWLKSRGKAPENFDPLGDAKSRRAAIDRAPSIQPEMIHERANPSRFAPCRNARRQLPQPARKRRAGERGNSG